MIKKALSLCLALAFIISFTFGPNTANAISNPVSTENLNSQLQSKMDQIAESTIQIDGKKAEKLMELAKVEIEKKHLNIHIDKSNIKYDEAVIVKQKETHLYTVYLPYNENAVVKGSSLTITFSGNKKMIGSQELIMRDVNEETGAYTHWVNGLLSKQGMINKADYEGKFEEQQQGFSISKFNSCLASQGISNWVIGVFVLVCGAACGTVILCAACIEGALLGYSIQFTYCLDKQR